MQRANVNLLQDRLPLSVTGWRLAVRTDEKLYTLYKLHLPHSFY
jgi:hypothetical protein